MVTTTMVMVMMTVKPTRTRSLPLRSGAVATALGLTLLGSYAVPVRAADAGMALARGSFRQAEAPVSGGFQIRTEAGRKVLVLSDDFRTNDKAPDLKVVFSRSANPLAASKPPAYPLQAGSYTILAPLKSPSGAQSYPIPASLDLGRQGSVLIWCRQFNATMAWSPLRP